LLFRFFQQRVATTVFIVRRKHDLVLTKIKTCGFLCDQDQVVRSDIFSFIDPFIDDIFAGRNPFDRLLGINNLGDNGSGISEPTTSWGLDRINQRRLPLDGNAYRGPYTGNGVDVYLLDSGISTSHNEFQGRASCSLNVVDQTTTRCPDGTGHGTHVAGIIGGRTYGVAPSVQLKSVKVLDNNGDGYSSWVMEGLEHVIQQAGSSSNNNKPIVVNLSLGAHNSDALNQAVDAAAAAGVVFVASAGNDGINACRKAPAGSKLAITVGSISNDDTVDSFSNYGECVDIFAPGSNIESASAANDNQSRFMTGTSQAAPHVAGVAALLLEQNPNLSTQDVWEKMKNDATNSAISMGFFSNHAMQGSPNRLVMTPM
jgi:subtilisin family serine protease